jgi:hypothetical protein
MGSVRVKGIGNPLLDKTIALRLRLGKTESVTKDEAIALRELVLKNLEPHIESGLLMKAFGTLVLYHTPGAPSSEFNAVGLGDRSILPKADTAPRGTIADFIEWVRGERAKRWKNVKEQYRASVAKVQGQIKAERNKLLTKKEKAIKRPSAQAVRRAKKQLAIIREEQKIGAGGKGEAARVARLESIIARGQRGKRHK